MKLSTVVIGTGPVGIRACEEISAINPEASISLYGDEPCEPYNRLLLSSYLADQNDFESIKLVPKVQNKTTLRTFFNCAITHIDTVNKVVYRSDGGIEQYDKVVLATGSTAHVPSIKNADVEGIFTLRTVSDADTLKQRSSQTTVVLGGGLLGLETARAIRGLGTNNVIVIDHSPSLMSRQLNKAAGDLLVKKVKANDIQVVLGNGVRHINGKPTLESIALRDGTIIECDTLVFAVGIRPNIKLAKQSGIATTNGIVVNNYLQTSVSDIYAVGECAEFNHLTYGIVAPGFEQARIMAENLCGGKKRYRGSILSTRLKVLDYPVFSMGRVGENESGLPDDRISFADPDRDVYRHLVIYRGRLIGCIALGEWTELSRIRSAIENSKRVWGCQVKRFRKTGLLWVEKSADSVVYWPDSAVVCNCNQITRGQLGLAITSGCQSLAQLSRHTQAGLTCGSCTSLLSELLGAQTQAVKAYQSLCVFSLIALILACLSFVIPTIPYQQTATIEWNVDQLWRDHFMKEFSGYSLLVCSLLVLTLSLRKRIQKISAGDFAWWRIMHVLIGFLTLLILVAHTGFRFGQNLNFYLMTSFSGLIVVGALAGLVISIEHKLNPGLARKLRNQFIWGHILLFWPLPVLLGFHILQSFYF